MVADAVSVPSGTRVFIELEQRVTSKKKHNQPGSFVDARIWRDVVVDGHTVVNAGAPVMVRIGEIKGAKVAGVKGFVELKAKQATAVGVGDAQPAKITLADSNPLTVEVLYERLDSNDEGRKEVKDLPMHLTVEGNVIGEARVVKVNDAAIEPIPFPNTIPPPDRGAGFRSTVSLRTGPGWYIRIQGAVALGNNVGSRPL